MITNFVLNSVCVECSSSALTHDQCFCFRYEDSSKRGCTSSSGSGSCLGGAGKSGNRPCFCRGGGIVLLLGTGGGF